MPPASTAQETAPHSDTGLGLTLQLGSDYEKKKQKLLQELQLDYKDYIATRKNPKTHEAHSQHRGLSLPICERASIKERLREERKKEYNLFLQEQERRSKRGTTRSVPSSEPEHLQTSNPVNTTSHGSPLPVLTPQTNTTLPLHTGRHSSRRDATTLTEGDTGGSSGMRLPHPRRRRRRQIHKPEELHTFKELNTDEEDVNVRHRRWTRQPENKERRGQRRRVNRYFKDVKAPDIWDQNNSDGTKKSDKGIQDEMRTGARPASVISKDESGFATGLKIGATEEQTTTQMKKEQYKQDLLRQIAEQQMNRIREKTLELRVAATGATDPEKEPDRIKQFDTVYQQNEHETQNVPNVAGTNLESTRRQPHSRYEDYKPLERTRYREPRGNSQMDFQLNQVTGRTVPGPGMGIKQGVPLINHLNTDYEKDLTRTAPPRVSSVAATDPDSYRNPHDAAHRCCGTWNPSDPPRFQNQGNQLSEARQFGILKIPLQRPSPVRGYEGSSVVPERLEEDESVQRRQGVLRYQEALQQQIKEREERKRREKEEKEQLDVKLEAEMKTHDPWGRRGGGAPNKDPNGNLLSDLKQMHRINNTRTSSPRAEAGAPLSQLPASSQSSPQDLRTYKEELKQQIEESKRKQAEEQERIRIEEEKEERRLAEQRARMLQEYQEEQRKQKETQTRRTNNWTKQIHEARTHQTEEVKRTRNKIQTAPQSSKETEENISHVIHQRQPSPPIPTVQKTLRNLALSSAQRSVSAPHVQPVPPNLPTLRDGRQEVIKELSVLRKYLRREQKQLELQLGQTRTYRPHLDRIRPRKDAFDFGRTDTFRSTSGSPAFANQLMSEFNQAEHGDVWDHQPIKHYYPRRKPGRFIPTDASLPSETVFLGEESYQPGVTPPPEERQEPQ